MIGDALQIPVPRYSLLPVTFSSLVHSHFNTHVNSTPVVYILRDGRDVLVSHFYKALNTARYGTPVQQKRVLAFHRSIISDFQNLPLEESLLNFYRQWRERPYGSRVSWGTHVKTWLEDKTPNIHIVRYEDMHENPGATLRKVVKELSGIDINDKVVDFSIWRNSFENKTGRSSGENKDDDNRRSGKAGGWRTTLSDNLKEEFLSDFGDILELGNYQT